MGKEEKSIPNIKEYTYISRSFKTKEKRKKKIPKRFYHYLNKRTKSFIMHFEVLATELVVQIFYSCDSVTDALHLGATCQHFQKILKSSRRLPILHRAAEAEFGMFSDLHNFSATVHQTY